MIHFYLQSVTNNNKISSVALTKSYQLNNMKQSKNSDINQYNWEIILSQAMTDKESTYLPAQKKITCSICGKDITTGNSVGNKDGDYCVPCWYKKEEKERQEEEAELMHKQWARWQAYLFSQSEWTKDGYLIPKKLCKKLQKLIDTPYSKLSKKQKERYLKEIKNL